MIDNTNTDPLLAFIKHEESKLFLANVGHHQSERTMFRVDSPRLKGPAAATLWRLTKRLYVSFVVELGDDVRLAIPRSKIERRPENITYRCLDLPIHFFRRRHDILDSIETDIHMSPKGVRRSS